MEEDMEFQSFKRANEDLISSFLMANTINQRSSKKRGSTIGRKNIHREFEASHNRIFDDYFADSPRYNDNLFERRFRMPRSLFLRLMSEVEKHSVFFQQKQNATGKIGASSLQKCVAAIRMLAYGYAGDACDEYCGISETLAVDSLHKFCSAIVEIYSSIYLRSPNESDIQRLSTANEARGFPGMLGSLDCMHWQWKNCPKAWKGQFQGKSGEATIILEAIASQDLWIWHCFFGVPGSNNDINVLNRSPLISQLISSNFPLIEYEIEGRKRSQGYFLTDGIYPRWSVFVQTITEPHGEKKAYFSRKQEAARKDVERAFGVLQSRFHILAQPSRLWSSKKMENVVSASVIIHNMIVEERRNESTVLNRTSRFNTTIEEEYETSRNDFIYSHTESVVPGSLADILRRTRNLQDEKEHLQLRSDLTEHLWKWRAEIMNKAVCISIFFFIWMHECLRNPFEPWQDGSISAIVYTLGLPRPDWQLAK